jgi:hypothetical protein
MLLGEESCSFVFVAHAALEVEVLRSSPLASPLAVHARLKHDHDVEYECSS